MNKVYLQTLKGRSAIFKVHQYSTGSNCLKVKFVDYGEDYKIKIVNYQGTSSERLDIQVVTYGEDVKLKKVQYGEDFCVYLTE